MKSSLGSLYQEMKNCFGGQIQPTEALEGSADRTQREKRTIMDFTFTTQLHYLIHVVDGEYVAHCLDMDLVGTGSKKESAIEELNTAVRGLVVFAIQSETSNILTFCKRAPARYWDIFEEARRTSGTVTQTLEVSPELSPVRVSQCHFTYCLAVAA